MSPAPAPACPCQAQGWHSYLSQWDAEDAVLEWVVGSQLCHGCFWLLNCAQLLRAVAFCLEIVVSPVTALAGVRVGVGGGAQGGREAYRSIITPCFLTGCLADASSPHGFCLAVTAPSSSLHGGGEGCAEAVGRLGMKPAGFKPQMNSF